MKTALLVTMGLLSVTSAIAKESVTLPLTEFKTLYRDSIEQAISDLSDKKTIASLISIEKADYQLTIDETIASGHISISGSLVQGKPEPIILFDTDLAVTELISVTGGRLISRFGKYCFVSDGSAEFTILMQVSITVDEDAKSRFLSFSIPTALQNSLKLDLRNNEKLIAMPGIQTEPGQYYFSPRDKIELRLEKPQSDETKRAPVIDTFTRISHRGKHLLLTSYFTPLRNYDQSIQIKTPAGARYLDSNLKPSWIKVAGKKKKKSDRLKVTLPSGRTQPFYIRYELPLDNKANEYALSLVSINGNKGREGEFTIEQPADRELSLSGDNITHNLSFERLPIALREYSNLTTSYAHLSSDSSVKLHIKKYKSVAMPEIVLESLQFFAVFDEGGSVMSSLKIQVPAQANDRLQIKPIPGAELWSVTVNNKSQAMFKLDEGMWIVPIQSGVKSVVEVKFLQAGESLGIQGQLQALVPDTGLTARYLHVAIALPKRVELVSLDADLAPAEDQSWIDDADYSGQAHYFSRAFYKGQSLDLAVYYKEPVTQLVEASR